MTPCVRQFSNEVESLITRYAQESDITFAEMIGALEFRKSLLIMQAIEADPQEPGDDEPSNPGE